jgi:hypothetical protein
MNVQCSMFNAQCSIPRTPSTTIGSKDFDSFRELNIEYFPGAEGMFNSQFDICNLQYQFRLLVRLCYRARCNTSNSLKTRASKTLNIEHFPKGLLRRKFICCYERRMFNVQFSMFNDTCSIPRMLSTTRIKGTSKEVIASFVK